MPSEYKAIIANLQDTVCDLSDFCKTFGIVDGRTLADVADLIKTIAQFRRMLRRAVLLFWRGDDDLFSFIDRMIYAIDEQYRRAWREGMREINLDPARDMRPEWEGVLQARIEQEYNYVLDLAQAVESARNENKPVDPLYSRVEIWVNRYNEVKDLAKTTCGADRRFVFRLGGAIDHCDTCQWLDGVVAFGSVWRDSGVMPQSPELICGGYHCQCRLEETDAPITDKQPQDAPR